MKYSLIIVGLENVRLN